MNLQDLTNNRERIIAKIKFQINSAEAVKGIMNKMVSWLGCREDIQDMKATKANIDKFTHMATLNWIKNDYQPFINADGSKNHDAINAHEAQQEAKKRASMSSFY